MLASPVFELAHSSVSNFFAGFDGASIPAASTAFEMARLRRYNRSRLVFSKSTCDVPSVSGSIESNDGAPVGTSDVVGGVGNWIYNPPVRSDRPSSDGATGTGGVRVTAPSNSTRVSSEAENLSLKILKCLCAELRASAAKDASRRITGRTYSSSRADSSSAGTMDVFFRKSLRDALRTGRGGDGSDLGVVVVGKVLDLERGGFGPFGARSDG